MPGEACDRSGERSHRPFGHLLASDRGGAGFGTGAYRMFSLLVLVGFVALVGCATTPPPLKGRPDLLAFLSDGQTTKTDAISALGQPSGSFESQRILTYRLGLEPRNNGYYLVEREAGISGWPTWRGAKFSLVLVFDDSGVLRKHSLVKVNE